jgi:hypothetical protein
LERSWKIFSQKGFNGGRSKPLPYRETQWILSKVFGKVSENLFTKRFSE